MKNQCNQCGGKIFTPTEERFSLCAGCLKQDTQMSSLQESHPLVEWVNKTKKHFSRSVKNEKDNLGALLKIMRRNPGKVALVIGFMVYILFM